MSTTTIRLSDELKARVVAAAERTGTTAHNFILQAIAEKAEQEERRLAFSELGDCRYAEIVATGKAIPWEAMRAYLEARLAGKKTTRPKPRKLGRG